MPRQHLRALFRDSSADELSQGQLRGKNLLEEAEEEEEPPVENRTFKVKVEKRPGRICSFMSGLKFRTPSVKINRSLFSKSKNAIVASRPLQCWSRMPLVDGSEPKFENSKRDISIGGSELQQLPGLVRSLLGTDFCHK